MRSNRILWAALAFVIAATGLSVSAQRGRGPAPLSTTPYDHWTVEQLSKPGNLGNYGSHTASIQRRDVGAAPETHTNFSHFLMFTSGQGDFYLGGQIVDGADGKKVVKGGEKFRIATGDMYHIPINTPHWVVPDAGGSVTYWVTNIFVEPPAR